MLGPRLGVLMPGLVLYEIPHDGRRLLGTMVRCGACCHLQVGLGGVLDATNVIPASSLALAVITAVGKDHVAALGGSLASIARAKAGIMKTGAPVCRTCHYTLLLPRGGLEMLALLLVNPPPRSRGAQASRICAGLTFLEL